MLAPHPGAPLEYTYFKVNAGPLALLVDWIERRKARESILRVSVHCPEKRAVLFEKLAAFTSGDRPFLSLEHTAGQLGEVAWDLAVEAGSARLEPRLFGLNQLRLPDMRLISAPLATFSGWMRCGAQRVERQCAPGLISHYWGRRLPHEWWWVSANQFDQEGLAVDCTVLRSGVWGLPLALPFAHLYLHRAGTQQLWTAPPGGAEVRGSPESFTIQFRRRGAGPLRLVARGRDYGDLGDGIINTLVGDLEIWEGDRLIARAERTAGLERRFPDGSTVAGTASHDRQ